MTGNLGIYIHVPFCSTKCTFCSFVTRAWRPETAERYRTAVVREIDAFFGGHEASGPVDSVYFGGGTPSLVPAEHITDILSACRRHTRFAQDCEITLEANPATITPEKAETYRAAGVNRISFGVESFDDSDLAALRRAHRSAEVLPSLELVRRHGISNVNLDLIAGLPRANGSKWLDVLERVIDCAPEHVSVYMLELDGKAPLFHTVQRGRERLPEDDLVADWYEQAVARLARAGYARYEISNFARPGRESRHNCKYWQREPVLGFGVGSHGFDGALRTANVPSLAAYFAAVEAGRAPAQWSRSIDAVEGLEETFYLGLRLRSGVDWDSLEREHPAERLRPFGAAIDAMATEGLLEWEGARVRLTDRGVLVSNDVFQEFLT